MAGLTKKLIPINLGATGIDRGANPQSVTSSWLKAENCRYTKEGKISKRLGYTSLGGERLEPYATQFDGKAITFDRELLAHEGRDWSSGAMAPVDDIAVWNIKKEVKSQPYNTKALQPNYVRFENGTVIECINEDVGASATSFIRTYSKNGRLINFSSTVVTAAFHSRIIIDKYDETRAFVWYITAGSLVYVIVNDDGTIGSEVDTLLSGAINHPLDIVQFNTPDSEIVFGGICMDAVGSNAIVYHCDIDNTTYNSASVAIVGTMYGVSVWQQSDDLFVVAYFDHPGIYLLGYDVLTFVNAFGKTQIGVNFGAAENARNISGIATSTIQSEATVLFSETDGTPEDTEINRIYVHLNTFPPTSGGQRKVFGKSTLATKAFVDNGDVFFGATQKEHNMYYLVDSYGLLCGKTLVDNSVTNEGTNDYFLADVSDVDNVRTTGAKEYLDADGHTVGGAILDVTIPDTINCVETKNSLLIGGSLPQMFDGQEVTELGYVIGTPETPPTPTAGSGTGNVDVGKHYWCYTYQWYDAKGQLHESAPSLQTEYTVAGAPDDVDIVIPTYQNTNKSDVVCVVYRTQVTTATATTFYRVGSVANSMLTDTVTFTDTVDDASIISNIKLYTTGGVLENIQAPSGGPHCLHQNRHFVVDAERPETEIRYSKPLASGIGVEDSDTLILQVPQDGGNITALASYMDRLIIFKENIVYATSGTGYTNLALGKNYKEPYILSESIGCIKENTVIRMPGALGFNSNLGIHNLTTKGVNPIGEAVRWYTKNYTYRSGILLPEQHLAVWVADNGPAIVYDFLYNNWTTWLNSNAKDIAIQDDILVFAGSGGSNNVLKAQVADTFVDEGVPFQTTLETGWISLAGIGGYKRIYHVLAIGYNIAAHRISMAFQYNFAPYWEGDISLDTTDISKFNYEDYYGNGLTSAVEDDAFIYEGHPNRQKVTSIRIQLKDVDQTGESYEITGLALVAGLKPGHGPEIGENREGTI